MSGTYKCPACKLMFEGSGDIEECPECGANSFEFEETRGRKKVKSYSWIVTSNKFNMGPPVGTIIRENSKISKKEILKGTRWRFIYTGEQFENPKHKFMSLDPQRRKQWINNVIISGYINGDKKDVYGERWDTREPLWYFKDHVDPASYKLRGAHIMLQWYHPLHKQWERIEYL